MTVDDLLVHVNALRDALKPFAAFANTAVPVNFPISQGSPMARRPLGLVAEQRGG